MRQAWLVGLGALVLSLGAVATDVMAGKQPPPPPPPPEPGPAKYVYCGAGGPVSGSNSSMQAPAMKMSAWNGAGKLMTGTTVNARGAGCVSFATYNGKRVVAQLVENGLVNIDGRPNADLRIAQLDTGATVTLLHDPTYMLVNAKFIPGSPGKIAFCAMRWTEVSSTPTQGLYQADMALDGQGNITGLASAPVMVYAGPAPIFDPAQPYIETTMLSAAWVSETKVVTNCGALYVLDLGNPGLNYVLSTNGGHPAVSPSGSKVAFQDSGIWEANLDGTGAPALVVPLTSWGSGSNHTYVSPSAPAYYDEGNIVYITTTIVGRIGSSTTTYDIWRLPRGGTPVNLTADTSEKFGWGLYVR